MEQAWLAGYRALDLTDEKGEMCGWILGSWGVDVIKVEPPGGSHSRSLGPFYHDDPDPEMSLSWLAYNSNKRSITLNLVSADGKDLFRRLAAQTDFIIESFAPGTMDNLGLGYSALHKLNPKIIMVSITPFGQTGPRRDYKGPDLVVAALGGLLYLCGDPERPPVKPSFPLAYPIAAADGAVGALIALHHRRLSGEGQHVDVSAQQSLAMCTFNLVPMWLLNKVILKRAGEYRSGIRGTLKQRQLWHCRDGEIMFVIMGGQLGAASNRALVEWMQSEGWAEQFLLDIDWSAFDPTTVGQERLTQLDEAVAKFFRQHTLKELYEGALKRRIGLCPVNSMKNIYENPQLADRGLWATVDYPQLGTSIVCPRPFVKVTGEGPQIRRSAPLIGEHNLEIYEQELGISRQELASLKETGAI